MPRTQTEVKQLTEEEKEALATELAPKCRECKYFMAYCVGNENGRGYCPDFRRIRPETPEKGGVR